MSAPSDSKNIPVTTQLSKYHHLSNNVLNYEISVRRVNYSQRISYLTQLAWQYFQQNTPSCSLNYPVDLMKAPTKPSTFSYQLPDGSNVINKSNREE